MSLQPTLRLFEKQLLENLGYGIDLRYEAHTHQRIESDRWYRYQMDEGLLAMNDNHKLSGLFSGKVLLAIASNDFSQPPVCAEAKRLMRLMITPLLGNKALMSRELLSPEGET